MAKLTKKQRRKIREKKIYEKERRRLKKEGKKEKINLELNSENLINKKVEPSDSSHSKKLNEYRNNHYVPRWYQKRFLPPDQIDQELYYLNLKPGKFVDQRGFTHQRKAIKRQGFRYCFSEHDLYTFKLGSIESQEIEKYFFGRIDNNGRHAVKYFTNFKHPSANGDAYENMMLYMSTQKLRTPKGLEWLADKGGNKDKENILRVMLDFRKLFCAIWTECIWLIADASQSHTKFIISDHPVTVYNRACGPRSRLCRGSNDPDIWLNGTHTIFPLSLDKILILTNVSWVRNPYQSEVSHRPNPNPLRDTIFKFTDIQTLRYLTEKEVTEINYIIKRRAFRYIAAAKEEWLYPENNITSTQWNSYGDGYLLMPDPRPVHLGGEIVIGYKDGSSAAFDEYGRRPWQPDYGKESNTLTEGNTLDRFKGEFARLHGPHRRGITFQSCSLDKECDNDDFHNYHLSLEKKSKKKTKTP
jgi:hypothetical protein